MVFTKVADDILVALNAYDSVVFPDDDTVICTTDCVGTGRIIQYIPRYKGEPDYYLLGTENVGLLGPILEAYEIGFRVICPNISPPSPTSILVGLAIHEVRRRVQKRFRPKLHDRFGKENNVSRISKLMLEDRIRAVKSLRISDRYKREEFDATFAEVAAVFELQTRNEFSVKNILTSGCNLTRVPQTNCT